MYFRSFIRLIYKNNLGKCRIKYYSTRYEQLSGGYQPQKVEINKTKPWEDSTSSSARGGSAFSMILPPPNVTGDLHLGHALTCTIQDVIARYKRRKGYDVTWIPGIDHAGIATQVVVEKLMHKESGQTRHDIGREEFLKEIWKWKSTKGRNIKLDLIRMGSTLDWDREYFTLDANQSRAVNEAFVRMFDDGTIYRGESLVNWSCILESAISDIEVDNLEISGPTQIAVPGYSKNVTFGHLTDITYRTSNENDEIVVATTRPETMLGDVAIAVHPSDPRYSKYQNTKLIHPFRKCEIPLIFDESVDPEFGSGAVKITPAHDKNDFEVARRHKLPINIAVFDEKGNIVKGFNEFECLPRFEAREKIKESLANLQLLGESRPHSMILPICSRSRDIIEYLIRPQWFVDCSKLSKVALDAVTSGELRIYPDSKSKEWIRWLSDCRDWCISRQLWWGHRIPAYEVTLQNGDRKWIAARSESELKTKLEGDGAEWTNIVQDSDVLDTWFSSSLLPFSSLGWPEETASLERFYPLDMMETGHDILFFWVARMVMLGQKLTGRLPFKEVLLHGIICDAHGRKMSKSLGNVISPAQVIEGATSEELYMRAGESYSTGVLSKVEFERSVNSQRKSFPNGIPECGTDALRFTMCSSNVQNHFINFDVTECHTNKLFFNKIWQASKYFLKSCENHKWTPTDYPHDIFSLPMMNQWILSRLAETVRIVENGIDTYNFHLATSALKNFFYYNFCDVFLETTKPGMNSNDRQLANQHCLTLQTCLSIGLQNLSFFAPYLSEELLKCVRFGNKDLLPVQNGQLEMEINQILDIASAIRQIKSQNNITKKLSPKVYLLPRSAELRVSLENYHETIKTLTQSDQVTVVGEQADFDKLDLVTKSTAGHLCTFGIIAANGSLRTSTAKTFTTDLNAKKLDKLQNELDKMKEIVSNPGYLKSANDKIKKKHMEKIKELEIEIIRIKEIS